MSVNDQVAMLIGQQTLEIISLRARIDELEHSGLPDAPVEHATVRRVPDVEISDLSGETLHV